MMFKASNFMKILEESEDGVGIAGSSRKVFTYQYTVLFDLSVHMYVNFEYILSNSLC